MPLLAALMTLCTTAALAEVGMPSAQQIGAAPAVPRITVYDDWQVVCDAQDCRAEPRRPVAAQITLTIVPDGSGTDVMILRGPLGLLLGQGVGVTVDGRSLGRLAFLTCELDGCVAPVRLDGALLRAFRAGSALDLVLTRRDGTDIAATVSLRGYIAATGALDAASAENLNENGAVQQ